MEKDKVFPENSPESPDLLIIYPHINHIPDSRTLLEIGVYCETVRRGGVSTSVLMLGNRREPERIMQTVRKFSPRMVLYYMTHYQDKFLDETAPELKKSIPEVHFCCGGAPPTIEPEKYLSITGIDSILLGEGETAIVDFCSSFFGGKSISEIRNFWFKKGDREFVKNPLRPLIEDLDILPFPDRSFYNAARQVERERGALPVIASRGCSCFCKFCACPQFREVYKGKGNYDRSRSVGNVISEINQCQKEYDFREVVFLDEMFPVSKMWMKDFAQRYPGDAGIPFRASTSVERLDDETLEMFKIAGCSEIILGIETGNAAFRNRICDRNIGNDKVRDAVERIKKAGIKVAFNVMTGLPLETEDMARETVAFCRDLKPSRVIPHIFLPSPGTPLYHYCRDNNYFSDRNPLELKEDESMLDLPMLPEEVISRTYHRLKMLNGFMVYRKKRDPDIYADLIELFLHKESDSKNRLPIYCDEKYKDGLRRFCLIQKPNTKLSIPLKIKAPGYIRFAVGLDPSYRLYTGAARYRFSIILIQNGKEDTVFEKFLKPGEDQRDRAWREYELPLLDIEDGNAFIRLEYRTPSKTTIPIKGLWAEPVISQRMSSWQASYHSEYEISQLKEKAEKAQRLLDETMAQNKAIAAEFAEISRENDQLLSALKTIEERLADAESREQQLMDRVKELLKIKRDYEKTLTGKMKKIFGKTGKE